MKLLVWTSMLYSKDGFPRDEEGNSYIPGSVLRTALVDAVVYYYTKKDRQIENTIRGHLMELKSFNFEAVAREIRRKIYEKYPFLEEISLPEKIILPQKDIYKARVEVFDLEKWLDVEDFTAEVFRGVVEIGGELPEYNQLKNAGKSFCEALLKMEMSMLEGHPLVESFYQPLLNDLKTWEFPLRVGMWTEERRRARLLFFWRIKEVRQHILKKFGRDIRPRRVLFLPREKSTLGWSEIQ